MPPASATPASSTSAASSSPRNPRRWRPRRRRRRPSPWRLRHRARALRAPRVAPWRPAGVGKFERRREQRRGILFPRRRPSARAYRTCTKARERERVESNFWRRVLVEREPRRRPAASPGSIPTLITSPASRRMGPGSELQVRRRRPRDSYVGHEIRASFCGKIVQQKRSRLRRLRTRAAMALVSFRHDAQPNDRESRRARRTAIASYQPNRRGLFETPPRPNPTARHVVGRRTSGRRRGSRGPPSRRDLAPNMPWLASDSSAEACGSRTTCALVAPIPISRAAPMGIVSNSACAWSLHALARLAQRGGGAFSLGTRAWRSRGGARGSTRRTSCRRLHRRCALTRRHRGWRTTRLARGGRAASGRAGACGRVERGRCRTSAVRTTAARIRVPANARDTRGRGRWRTLLQVWSRVTKRR